MTLNEIREAVRQARRINDLSRVNEFLDELEAHRAPVAEALKGFVKAVLQIRSGQRDQAWETANTALELAHDLDDQELIGDLENLIGFIQVNYGQFNEALTHYYRSLSIRERIGDVSGRGVLFENIAWVNFSMGDHPQAIEFLQKALEIHIADDNPRRASYTKVTLAGVLVAVGQRKEAEALYYSAIDTLKEEGDNEGIARAIGNLGVLHERYKEHERTLELYREAAEYLKLAGDSTAITRSYGNLGNVLCALQRWDEARYYVGLLEAAESLDPAEEISLHEIRSSLAEAEGDLETAQSELLQALEVAQTAGMRAYTGDVLRGLRDLARTRNDFDGYIAYNERYTQIINEIEGKEIALQIAKHEMERLMEREREEAEKQKMLLYGALPRSVADRKLAGEDVSADHFSDVTVLFLDIVGFTAISDRIPAGHVIHLLKAIFQVCDDVCRDHDLTKIKTIGDSYMAVAGVPEPLPDHAERAARAALDMLRGLNELELTMDPALGDTSWTQTVGELQVRIGLHSGPVVAGIVGDERLQYDVWGDTVNVASRMESTGKPGKIQLSERTASMLTSDDLTIVERGEVSVKGKGTMTTYWLEQQTSVSATEIPSR